MKRYKGYRKVGVHKDIENYFLACYSPYTLFPLEYSTISICAQIISEKPIHDSRVFLSTKGLSFHSHLTL